MNKQNAKWFLSGIFLILVFGVSAFGFEAGEIISREAFSEMDFTNQHLDCHHVNNTMNREIKPVIFKVNARCLTAKIIDTENILVYWKPLQFDIYVRGRANLEEGEMPTWFQCMLSGGGHTATWCWDNVFVPKHISPWAQEERHNIRRFLNKLRDRPLGNINGGDFNVTRGQLND